MLSEAFKGIYTDPEITDGEKTEYIHYYNEEPKPSPINDIKHHFRLDTETITLRRLNENGREVYNKVSEQIQKNGNIVMITSSFAAGDEFEPISITTEEHTADGHLVEYKKIDYKELFRGLPPDIVPTSMMSAMLKGVDFAKTNAFSCIIFMDKMVVMRMNIKLAKEEKLKVKAGEFDCLKIEMMPDMTAMFPGNKVMQMMAKSMAQPVQYWFSADDRRIFVKNTYSAGMPGSPKQVQELSEL